MISPDLQTFLQNATGKLGQIGGAEVILGCFGCMEFNLSGYPFPGWSNRESRRAVADKLLGALGMMRRFKWAFVAEMHKLNQAERAMLLEREMISGSMAARQDGVYVLINDRQDTKCCINDEEHFLIEVFHEGGKDSLKRACQGMRRLQTDFGKKLPIAYDPSFGYLSSDPTKGGESTYFASVLHLPGMRLGGHLESTRAALDELDVFLSPIVHAEGDDHVGDIYLLHSPAVMLGQLSSAVKTMEKAMDALCKQELMEREKMMASPRAAARLAALVNMSYELLTQSRKLQYAEFLYALSMLRLGIITGLLEAGVSGAEFSALYSRAFFGSAPMHLAHLQGAASRHKQLSARAALARSLVTDQLMLHPSDSLIKIINKSL